MIGQDKLINTIYKLIESDSMPRFIILTGDNGCGKSYACKLIAKKLRAIPYECGSGVQEVRDMIKDAYKATMPILYYFPRADSMSPAAKNALLKVTEEPPRLAYFALCLTDAQNTLQTIRSRGQVFKFAPYSPDDILKIAESWYTLNGDESAIVRSVCQTPGDVELIASYGIKSFYNYVNKVVKNVAVVSGANSFKIANNLAMRSTDTDKYDLSLFWKSFIDVCLKEIEAGDTMLKSAYSQGVLITCGYNDKLRFTSLNKQMLFDNWLLDIRKEWRLCNFNS